MSCFLGVDVGGTTSTVCLGDDRHRLIAVSPQFSTRSIDGPDATVDDLASAILQMLHAHGLSLSDVAGITLATPGPATLDGVLLSTPNLVGQAWNLCPIRQRLQDKLGQTSPGVSVRYLGDGQAAALGEYAVRSGRLSVDPSLARTLGIEIQAASAGMQSLFMVAVGTGFGGGEVRDGHVVRGVKGRAGHAGHLMLPRHAFRHDAEQQIRVGNAISTVESAVSLTALTHQLAYRMSLPQWADHPLHDVAGTPKDRAKRLRELAAGGDSLACELFEDQAAAIGIALLMIQYIGDYDELVIGGGVCDLAKPLRDRYLKLAKESFYRHALDGFRDFEAISFSRCGDSASVIGALVDATTATSTYHV